MIFWATASVRKKLLWSESIPNLKWMRRKRIKKDKRSGLKTFDRDDGKTILLLIGILLTALCASFAVSEDHADDGSSCVSELCHQDRFDEDASSLYLHMPFVEKQCESCHMGEETSVSSADEAMTTTYSEPLVVERLDYFNEHTILVSGLEPQSAYDIGLVLRDMLGNTLQKRLDGVVVAEVENIQIDDRKAPTISAVKTGPVLKGVFLEAMVTWETDEAATSVVEYGLSKKYGQKTPEDKVLTDGHRVTLHGLRADQLYHFRVVSKDIFGNVARSPDFTLNTNDVISASEGLPQTESGHDGDGFRVENLETFVFNSELGLYIETTVPVRATVECVRVEKANRVPVADQNDVVTGTDNGDVHDLIIERKAWALEACYGCHLPESLGVSHPVGVEPSGKTTIPEDLPMEGGVITCVTCHKPHGGARKYFAQKEITEDICISCHEGY